MSPDGINAGHALTLGLLIAALVLYLYACRVLTQDARGGPYLTMGGEMYFSQLWIVASILTAVGAIRLFGLGYWLGVPGVIALYALSFAVRRGIKALFLGVGQRGRD